MKELSQSIRVIPLYAVPDTFSGAPEELLSVGYKFHADSFTFEPTKEEENLYNCSTDIPIDTPQNNPFKIYRNAIILFKYANSDQYIIIGNTSLPARVMIDSALNSSVLHITAKMLHSPF